MSRAAAIRTFRAAVELLRSIDPKFSIYVANTTMHLMKGPSHDDRWRPLQDNIVDTGYGVRISGGDW